MIPPVFAAPKFTLSEIVENDKVIDKLIEAVYKNSANDIKNNPDKRNEFKRRVRSAYSALETNQKASGGSLYDALREIMYGTKTRPRKEKELPSNDRKGKERTPVPTVAKTSEKLKKDIEKLLEDGEREFNNNNYGGAIENFNAAYRSDSKNFRVVYNLATAHAYADHRSEAIKFYKEALSIAPDDQNKEKVQTQIKKLESGEIPAAGKTQTPIKITINLDSILKEFKGENGNVINVMEIMRQLGLYGKDSHVIGADTKQKVKDPNEERRIEALQKILIEIYDLLKKDRVFITFLNGRLRELSGGKTNDEKAEKELLGKLIRGEMPLKVNSKYDKSTRILVELLQLYSNKRCATDIAYNTILGSFNTYLNQNRNNLSAYAQKRFDTFFKSEEKYKNFIVSDNGEFDVQTLGAVVYMYSLARNIRVVPLLNTTKPPPQIKSFEVPLEQKPPKRLDVKPIKKDDDMPVF